MSTEQEKTRDIKKEISIEEFLADRLERQRVILESIEKRKPIHILIQEDAQESAIVKFLAGRNQLPLDFARVVYTKGTQKSRPKVPVALIESPDELPALFVYESPEFRQYDRYVQIGKFLPGFLEEIIPQAGKRPIWIYRSIEEYRLQLPLVKIRYFGKLITANISSALQS